MSVLSIFLVFNNILVTFTAPFSQLSLRPCTHTHTRTPKSPPEALPPSSSAAAASAGILRHGPEPMKMLGWWDCFLFPLPLCGCAGHTGHAGHAGCAGYLLSDDKSQSPQSRRVSKGVLSVCLVLSCAVCGIGMRACCPRSRS